MNKTILIILFIFGCHAEDYSAVVASIDVGYSEERKFGSGLDATASYGVFNFSGDVSYYQKYYDDRRYVASAYAGIGLMHVLMAQVGYGNDGIVYRLRGSFDLPYNKKFIFNEFSPAITYSVGIDSAGYNIRIGLGMMNTF